MSGGVVKYSVADLQQLAAEYALAHDVPALLFLQQITIESNWKIDAISAAGALGLAQFLPSTANAPGYGIAPFDPLEPNAALQAACQYDRAMFRMFGTWGLALMAYNAGPGNIYKKDFSLVSHAYQQLAKYADGIGPMQPIETLLHGYQPGSHMGVAET